MQAINWYGCDLNSEWHLQQCLFDWWAELSATRVRAGRRPPSDELDLLVATAVYETVVGMHWHCEDQAPAAAAPTDVAAEVLMEVTPCLPELDVWMAALWATIMNMPGTSNMSISNQHCRTVCYR